MVLSVGMLACCVVVRVSAPCPYAPRVNVRWVQGLSEVERTNLERRFSLVAGEHREQTTWSYELADPNPELVKKLIEDPSVDDTSQINREGATVDRDAPRGSTRVTHHGLARLINSSLFLWLTLFWLSSVLVSGAWLAAENGASSS